MDGVSRTGCVPATQGEVTAPDFSRDHRNVLSSLRLPAVTAVQAGRQGSLPIEDESPTLNDEQGGSPETDFSKDHHFLDNNFTIKLFIRHNDSHDLHDYLDQLKVSSIEEEYTSGKGNYIIATERPVLNVGFKSLFNLANTPNELFMCEV